VTSRAAARRYARALFDVALKEAANLQDIEDQLAGFLELLRAHPPLERVLLNPAVPAPRKRDAVRELVARGRLPAILGKLLVLLAERDRLALLPELRDAYRDRLLDHRNVVRAEVTTAAPLSAERSADIARRLERATGRTVTVQTRVDPAIVGGIVARVGSTVYDGSVTRQLEKVRQTLED
jgi:F-type H+-transporting ATPase subunit delta